MGLPTVALNEATPAGASYVRAGDDRIREYKTQVREILEVDHYFPSSGQNDACGRHKQMTLIEAANIGSGAAGIPILGAQTADGKPELVFTDEDDTDVQITKGGVLNLDDVTKASLAVLIAFVYPIGSIYTAIVSTNPGTLLGFGTWVAFGAGRTLVGLNAGDGDFDTVEETGGAKTHSLATSEMPAHTHTTPADGTPDSVQSGGGSSPQVKFTASTLTSSTGGGGAHNNVQPYIVVYMWKRTA